MAFSFGLAGWLGSSSAYTFHTLDRLALRRARLNLRIGGWLQLAHAPEEVSEHYPGVNRGLLRECRILVLAMIKTWRWDRGDQLPNSRQLGTEWLSQIRAALERNGLDTGG